MGKDRLLPCGVGRRQALAVTLALAASTFGLIAPAGAAAPRADLPPSLRVISGGTVEMGAPNVARQDLGVVDGTTHPVLQAVFVLRNTGRDPVTITDLQTSCGCASALLGAAGTPALPVTLAPGGETSVQGTVRLQDLDGPTTDVAPGARDHPR